MKLKKQQEAEFRAFATAQRASLRKYAFLLCADWYEADDIVQKSLTKLFAAWKRVDPGGASAYARKIVTNTYLSHLRRSWVRRERATGDLPDRGTADTPQDDIDRQLEMADALNGLPPRQRATLILRYWEQLSVEETANAMGCSTGTVKSQTSKAIGTLRRTMSIPAPNDPRPAQTER
ncbi:SigE family RNA polymerase sigma factor [Glycomyces salinus]|uniref:SigE family RNA polymerase sigma factor n=1 Tax=Glycomyces salinus TaxID=980294 RepID=UPI0018EAA174|nr:SigE family RNA polymerase sigma factor [Glycomyces salinus]